MKKYSKLMAVLLVVAMILPGIAQAAPVAEELTNVTRLEGIDRVGTSVAASKEAYKGTAEAVVLTGFGGDVDALTGTLLAGAKDAPLLITRKAELSDAVAAEIARLEAKTVYILGGETVVSAAVATELEKDYKVERIAGDNREETAVAVAKEVKGKEATNVFLALGRMPVETDALADALAIGPVSAMKNMPVLLTRTNSIPAATVAAMKDLGVTNVTIVGGKSAVSEVVATELEELGYKVDRVDGDSRENTAIAIAERYFEEPSNLIVAFGRKSADALVGGYLGAKLNAPVLLTNNVGLTEATETYITENPLNTYVLGGEIVISGTTFDRIVELIEGEEVEEEELVVESVSAINAKTLKVTFNKEVEETKDAKFAVKRDAFKVNVASVEWNEENTEATLNLTSKILKGEYSVEVTGLTEEALTGSVKTEAEKVDKINILTEEAPKVSTKSNGTVTKEEIVVKYEVLNQYGEDVTKLNSVTATAAGKNVVSDADENQAKGTITITAIKEFDKDAEVNLTVVHGNTGTVVNKVVKVVAEAKIDNVQIGELYNKDGKTLSEDTVISKDKFYLPIEVKDQYGNAVTKATDVTGELIVTNTNDSVLTVNKTVKEIKIDNKDVLALEITSVGVKGSTDVLTIVTSTGKQDRVTLEVAEGVKTDELVLSQPEGVVTAGKDTLFPLTVYNNKGEEVTDVDKANVTITGAEQGLVKKDGKLYVKVKDTNVNEGAAITITVMSETNKVVTQTVVPKAKAEPQIIVGLKEGTKTSFREDTEAKIETEDFIFEDQYGQEIKDLDNAEVKVKATIEDAAKSPIAIKSADNLSVKENANYTGDKIADTVIFKIYENNDAVESSAFEQTFTVVKDSAISSYEVKDMGVIVVEDKNAEDEENDVVEYQVVGNPEPKIEVVGKSSDGEVGLKNDEYKVLSFDGISTITISGEVGEQKIANQTIKDLKFPKDAKEVTKSISIVIEATGEVIKKDVLFSTEKVKTDKLVLLNADNKTKFNDDKAYVELTKETFEGSATVNKPLNKTEIVKLVKVGGFDQYGNRIDTGTIDTNSIRITGDRKEVTIEGNLTDSAAVTKAKAGAKVTVYLREGAVESKGIEITLKNGVVTQAELDKIAADALIEASITAIKATSVKVPSITNTGDEDTIVYETAVENAVESIVTPGDKTVGSDMTTVTATRVDSTDNFEIKLELTNGTTKTIVVAVTKAE